MEETKKIQMAFASIDEYVTKVIPDNTVTEVKGKDFMAWGKDNHYPDFLYSLYETNSTLQSIINGTVDYAMGNEVQGDKPNPKQDLEEFLSKVFGDYVIFGIAYVNVLRSLDGNKLTFYWMDARKVRSNEDNTVFYYSDDWSVSYGRVKAITLPKYTEDGTDGSSVIMIKNPLSRGCYAVPVWASAIKAVVTETEVTKFHLNEVINNFSASAIINFNNGVPEDSQKDEIEKNISEKFAGSENAGRFLLAFNDGKERAVTVERLGGDDFDKRYDAVSKKSRQDIFTAFRANPNLFGIPTENLGFSDEEYKSSFKLYNRTAVKPIQRKIVNTFAKLGWEITIEPFSIEDNEEETVE